RERAWLDGIRSRPVLADPVREIDRRQEQVTALAERGRRSLTVELGRAPDDPGHLRARLPAPAPSPTLPPRQRTVPPPRGGVPRAGEVSAGERLTVRFASDQRSVTADGAHGP